MRIGLMVVGALLVLVGLVWIGQGAGLIAGSFMTGQPTWLAIGIVVVLAGAGLVWWAATGYRRFP